MLAANKTNAKKMEETETTSKPFSLFLGDTEYGKVIPF